MNRWVSYLSVCNEIIYILLRIQDGSHKQYKWNCIALGYYPRRMIFQQFHATCSLSLHPSYPWLRISTWNFAGLKSAMAQCFIWYSYDESCAAFHGIFDNLMIGLDQVWERMLLVWFVGDFKYQLEIVETMQSYVKRMSINLSMLSQFSRLCILSDPGCCHFLRRASAEGVVTLKEIRVNTP